jgi:hypothetical protein
MVKRTSTKIDENPFSSLLVTLNRETGEGRAKEGVNSRRIFQLFVLNVPKIQVKFLIKGLELLTPKYKS